MASIKEIKNEKENVKSSYKKLVAKSEGFEYYIVYENGKSHVEVNLIQPSWNEQSYWERMPRWGF